jgi:hypothetical protein
MSNNLPAPGRATEALSSAVETKIGREQLLLLVNESASILSNVKRNTTSNASTGLIVGYVQSGKTLSLTTVSSIARDNGYGMIIVLCGVTNKLFEQNADRLEKDLVQDLNAKANISLFSAIRNPDIEKKDFITSTLKAWRKEPNDERAVVCLLLKTAARINDLAEAISLVDTSVMDATPTLIIDDEAHMAGLNTQHESESESAVYAAIKRLRAKIRNHTYLQYTATPQAPLLVHIADCVSPDFCQILTPGSQYVGGREFFTSELTEKMIVEIKDAEIETTNAKGKTKKETKMDFAPESLRDALITYLIGVADGCAKGEQRIPNACRSMLIHPHFQTIKHARYKSFVTVLLADFETRLEIKGDVYEFHAKMRKAYESLKLTYDKISSFEVILDFFPTAIEEARKGIQAVNSNPRNQEDIKWGNSYSHILIGGEVLGVGFTVEGLTVTYMPRSSEKGQFDSMQQRARFFGYRKPYLGLCRVYLTPQTAEAYKNYVIHEEDMRGKLAAMAKSGKKLKEWKREFLLHPGMKLTRKNIQSLETLQFDLPSEIHPRCPFLVDPSQNATHLALIEKLKSIAIFKLDDSCTAQSQDSYRHLSAELPLSQVLDQLQSELSWNDPEDSHEWNSALILLKVLKDENKLGDLCKVMIMRPNGQNSRTGEDFRRSYAIKKDQVVRNSWNPFQSSSSNYAGDKQLADKRKLTIQLHVYDFIEKGQTEPKYKKVLVPAIIPTAEMRKLLAMIKQN